MSEAATAPWGPAVGHRLGVDLGTTWTAAAIARDDGSLEVVGLGTRSSAVPTLVHVGADGEVAVGESAARREAFGTLPDGSGSSGDGEPVRTDFGITIESQLDGQGRITGGLRLSADPEGPCGDASYAASFEGLPA